MRLKKLCTAAKLTDEKVIVNKFITGLKDKLIKYELMKDDRINTFAEALKQAKLMESLNGPSTSVDEIDENRRQKRDHNNSRKDYKNKLGNNKRQEQRPDKSAQPQQHSKQQQVQKNQCFFCKGIGHWKWQCRKLKSQKPVNDIKTPDEMLGSLTLNK